MNHIHNSGRRSLNVAVIGTGIAGMSAAWLLSEAHQVTVYEKEARPGGHSHTVDVDGPAGQQPVDTGFIVYNEINYPNLVALFDHLGVPSKPSDMTFSVSLQNGRFEFGSSNINSAVGQRSNLLKPRFWQMLNDMRRFYADAEKFMTAPGTNWDLTLGQFLTTNGYGDDFINRFILPMGAAIWSTRHDEMRQQPALTFIRFFASHGLLEFDGQIPWRTVDGGSREYVQRLTAAYADQVQLGNGARSIKRFPGGVEITDSKGDVTVHDAVVIATHADEALGLLSDADGNEKEILGAFRYTDNHVILHSDQSLMPKRKRVWSSWNYMGAAEQGVSVTYWMNLLQSIDPNNPLFVTVNPNVTPDPSKVYRTFEYQHPFFDIAAWQAQERLWELQGNRQTWFAGSYFGYGFHEDALQAGLAAAEELGDVRRPWNVANESGRIHLAPALSQAAE